MYFANRALNKVRNFIARVGNGACQQRVNATLTAVVGLVHKALGSLILRSGRSDARSNRQCMPIDRRQLMLAAMAAGGDNASYLPVQTQKLFFLIDREASHVFNGPHFNFQPYDYGPFDRLVYDCLDYLNAESAVVVSNNGRYRSYRLTPSGYLEGRNVLDGMTPQAKDYLQRVAGWVRALNFQQLVTAIYNRYPEMKVNSVFR